MNSGPSLTLYAVPDPFDSLEQAQRYYHADLPHLSRADLVAEQQRVALRILLASDRDRDLGWLEERLVAIKGALHG